MENVVIIGAGPTGLFASSLLLAEGYSVDLYDQNRKAGRKLLLAGKSGLNVTNQLDPESFSAAYGSHQEQMKPSLIQFAPADLRLWLKKLGIETFTGSTGKVFPVSSNAETLLSLWMTSLLSHKNFRFYPEHRLVKIKKGSLYFEKENKILTLIPPLVVMGLGGASYPSTGSDGQWRNLLEEEDIKTISFKPVNCGFECSWSPFFKNKFSRLPLKNIKLTHRNQIARGETMITSYGMEGGPIYKFSREIRDSIEKNGKAVVFLDMTPDLPQGEVLHRLNRKQGKNSLSNHLRKQLNLSAAKLAILRELTEKTVFDDFSLLAPAIKKLPLILERPRPIEEAISTSGGVSFQELDKYFMLKKYPGWFTAGEMVDWDAPTGGYLLQGCFSTAYRVVEGIKYGVG
ncbi:MAG: TIGR03862 family flavoprotein [Spirochaetales bacterium]|nr:TIGR03862 family flavoprotein [Spirochaetales bacterium]